MYGLAARNAAVAPCTPCTHPVAPTAGPAAGPGNNKSGLFWQPPSAASTSFPPTTLTPASTLLDDPTPLASATLAAASSSPVCPGTAALIFDQTDQGGRCTQRKAPETDMTKMKSWRAGGVKVGAAKKGALDALSSNGKSLAKSSSPGAERPAADGARGTASAPPSRTEAPPSPAQASFGDEANTVEGMGLGFGGGYTRGCSNNAHMSHRCSTQIWSRGEGGMGGGCRAEMSGKRARMWAWNQRHPPREEHQPWLTNEVAEHARGRGR